MTKLLSEEKIDDLSREMVKGGKSVNWLCRAIETAVQRPIADLMCQWKSGKISGDELADKLFSLFASTPSSAVLEAQSTDQRLLNLLCRIHRDGGHYIAEHGLDKAVEDADIRVAEQNAALDAQAKQEPVAWLARGIHGGKVIAAKLHNYKQDADNTASVFIEHYGAAETVPLFAAPVVQPDMVMVPREPTEAMLDVAMNRYQHVSPEAKARYTQMHRENFRCDYKAMLAAAKGKLP